MKKIIHSIYLAIILLLLMTSSSAASTSTKEAILACMGEALKTATSDKTVGELRATCETTINNSFSKRKAFEKIASENPFAILPHRPNYVLPITYSEPDYEAYSLLPEGAELENIEAKFQVSIKYIAVENFFYDNLNLQFAFTGTSWWQTYNSAISSPFRETNYEPELIFSYTEPWSFFGLDVGNSYISLNHQSNGKSGSLSRSWNRVIGGFTFGSGDLVWALKVWWRVPEAEKDSALDPDGDDNPHIERYLGYGELAMLWQINDDHNLEMMLRNNLRSDNNGAITLGWSFPLTKNLRGYVEYFNGYGESLIFYDQSTERLGIGVKLTDWL
ncbi:MAG: phospholipase A1 [Enterobacterales bacterium]|jgi:phospholipase A1